jgi:uncharacterized membrane protein YedE/YeeE
MVKLDVGAADSNVGATFGRPEDVPVRRPEPYTDPYLAGVGIGLVLLTAYVVAGRGLGASGAFASVVAAGAASVQGTAVAAAAPQTAPYLADGLASPLYDWLVLELIGVVLGGFASAWFAGRTHRSVERGPGIDNRQRMYAGFGGGILMGFGAKLARGCTSGQALTGGALLSPGSWIFIATCFASGYLLAPLARRLWR